jgi:hypothetical protein
MHRIASSNHHSGEKGLLQRASQNCISPLSATLHQFHSRLPATPTVMATMT